MCAPFLRNLNFGKNRRNTTLGAFLENPKIGLFGPPPFLGVFRGFSLFGSFWINNREIFGGVKVVGWGEKSLSGRKLTITCGSRKN